MAGIDDLTQAERALFHSLPKPPLHGGVATNNVWIIEWLYAGNRKTVRELRDWMETLRPGWSHYISCYSGAEVIDGICQATEFCLRHERVPVLHIEAHGCKTNLEGPNRRGGKDILGRENLTPPLQDLNLATRCNLLVFFAACTGFAGIQALTKGPRAPAVCMVGFDA